MDASDSGAKFFRRNSSAFFEFYIYISVFTGSYNYILRRSARPDSEKYLPLYRKPILLRMGRTLVCTGYDGFYSRKLFFRSACRAIQRHAVPDAAGNNIFTNF